MTNLRIGDEMKIIMKSMMDLEIDHEIDDEFEKLMMNSRKSLSIPGN